MDFPKLLAGTRTLADIFELVKRAVERDEEAIERWKRKDWPRVKKTLRGWAPISSSRTNQGSC